MTIVVVTPVGVIDEQRDVSIDDARRTQRRWHLDMSAGVKYRLKRAGSRRIVNATV